MFHNPNIVQVGSPSHYVDHTIEVFTKSAYNCSTVHRVLHRPPPPPLEKAKEGASAPLRNP